jgi:hypothetical protein
MPFGIPTSRDVKQVETVENPKSIENVEKNYSALNRP